MDVIENSGGREMEENKIISGESLSVEKFKNTSREFGIMPFWFWNGQMDYKEMEYQLKEYYDKGIPGIFIHARFGIKNYMPYLSDEWFDRVKFTIKKAKEIGLQVWVYDEYNWPSGTAGQQVMAADPELTERYLELIEMDIPGQFFTFLEGTDSRYVDMEQSEPVYACAILEDDLKNGVPKFIDLMPNLCFDKVIAWEAPKGPWKLFYFIERKASWYIDTLNEDSTKKFLELTHERYKEAMDNDFTGNIKGFYTDEPAMHYFEVGKDNYVIPWSKKIFELFKEDHGYDLKPHLPKLYYDLGGDTAQVRYDFWSTLTRQYEKAYFEQIKNWCHENGVVFTGHLLFEEWLRKHARASGNLFNYLKHLDVTGVDHLYPRIGTREMPDEHVALKVASSAAHQFGSTRLLCESLGGSYWDVTMERMKWIADWEYVLGVNLFNPHGFHYSIEGERKRDWPPSQFYHHTWWRHYGVFNDYIKRLSYMLSGGRHVAKIAVLYPINSIWTNYMPQSHTLIGDAIEADFNYLTDTLLRLHMDFDYIDEDVLKDAQVKDGSISIRDESYSLLILPPVTHIKESTLDIMEKLYADGGCILADAILPYGCVEGEADGFIDRIKTLFGVDPVSEQQSFVEQLRDKYTIKVNANDRNGKALFIEGPGLNAHKPMELLDQAIRQCIQPDIEIDDPEVFYLHRVKDDKDFYFIVNPVEQGRDVSITIHAQGMPEIWDLETGDVSAMNCYKTDKNNTQFKLYMQPYSSALVSLAPYKGQIHAEHSDLVITEIDENEVRGYGRIQNDARLVMVKGGQKKSISLPVSNPMEPIKFGRTWEFAVDGYNALLISHWKVAIDQDNSGLEKGYGNGVFDDSGWMDFKMGAWEMQLPVEWDAGHYPVNLWYRAYFDVEQVPENISLLIDGFKGKGYDVFINGRRLNGKPGRSWMDAEIGEIDIKDYLKEGKNTIAVRLLVSSKTDGILDLLKITGDFALRTVEGGYAIGQPVASINTGDWAEQGYPYFSGTGQYTQNIFIDESYIGNVLKLEVDCGTDLAELYVNDNRVGLRPWHPYEFDITPYARAGWNKISLKITNTLINVLEGVKKPSGIFDARIVPYNSYEIKL
jgi:hypothetical protein